MIIIVMSVKILFMSREHPNVYPKNLDTFQITQYDSYVYLSDGILKILLSITKLYQYLLSLNCENRELVEHILLFQKLKAYYSEYLLSEHEILPIFNKLKSRFINSNEICFYPINTETLPNEILFLPKEKTNNIFNYNNRYYLTRIEQKYYVAQYDIIK